MKRFILLAATLFLLAPSGFVSADSIWMRADPRYGYLFVDTNARKVGDLLTVVVRENTGIGDTEERNMQKNTQTGGLFNFKGSTTGLTSSRSAAADFNATVSSQRQFDGKLSYTSDRNFIDRVTVVVVQVLPNGNLVIDGVRRRIVSGEERVLHLTGMVRPYDIGPDNTIQSQSVGNFQISYHGRGSDSSYTNQGWMGHIMNHLWPF